MQFGVSISYPRSARRRAALSAAVCAAMLVAGCNEPLDIDLRDLTSGFDTTSARAATPARPAPDSRGVISYPNYQVVVAQRGDTVRTISARLGLNAEDVARYNGISPDVELRRDEIVALPVRVAEPSPATGAATTGPIQPPAAVDVTTLASDAIDRAGDVTVEPTAAVAAPAPATPAAATGVEPVRHQVQRGETAFSIARLYNVDVGALAEWNGLSGDLAIREGQFLLVPISGAAPLAAPTQTAAPGEGSTTPVPPSAAAPLPDEVPPAAASDPEEDEIAESSAPDLGSEQSATASDAPMIYPVSGSIIRAYASGRNEGIDIAATAGTPVRAAAAGTVAAITTDTAGIQIVVIRHPDNLLTVYTHVDNLAVERNQSVGQGTVIGEVLAGDPSFLHFEVRQGTESTDPANYLP